MATDKLEIKMKMNNEASKSFDLSCIDLARNFFNKTGQKVVISQNMADRLIECKEITSDQLDELFIISRKIPS